MDKQHLQKLLQKKYNRNEWNSILEEIFPSVNFLKEPEKIEVSNKNVKSFHQTGLVRLNDGKNLAVFEVVLDEGINLLRNRVALRNLTTHYIDQANNHGVLVVYDQGKENYRFTFVTQESGFNEKGEWATFETASKRFTYVLGEGESCRTASERLAYLASKKNSVKINDIIDAFSVEQLSKEFFAKYKEHYQAFVDYLVSSNFYKSAFNGNEKSIRDFVKKTLGRIVFLYFLQKKGWLGASDEFYSDGDNNFMQTFWETSGKNENFYSLHLCRLFFNGLNANNRSNDTFEMPNGKLVKVPYLNGGLFDKDKREPDYITFPPKLFDGLFSYFSEYNFTIDENDPEEHEIGIDPEMLGHIFENLLEDNKDKGAYYTPKEIVQFMTQESLIEYLKTGLEKKNHFLSDNENNALKYFVRYKLKGDEIPKEDLKEDIARFYQNQLHFIQSFGSQVNKLLDDVRICDPAIGSGAFPMGLLNEIYHCKLILNSTYTLAERAAVKRHIIEYSIYGVDIEKGAVDIARLRFWLSLIVDEEKPSPLPNLDYKIVPGDSLVSRFEDEIIDIDWNLQSNSGGLFEQDLFNTKSKLLTDISNKQKKYFESNLSSKEKLNLEIRNLKLDILINQLQSMIEKSGVKYHDEGKIKTSKQLAATILVDGWKRTLNKLEGLKQKPDKSFNHFDWKLDFPEILNPLINNNDKGFDIVIGNPPYLRIQGIRKDNPAFADTLTQNYKSATGSYDLYATFLERAFYISKETGVINYIMPVKWTNAAFGQGLRKVISDNKAASKIISFGAYQVFNASTYTGLQWFKKQSPFLKFIELDKDLKSNSDLKKFLFSLDDNKFCKIQNLTENPWALTDNITSHILSKINKHHLNIDSIFEKIFQGLATSKDDVYFLYNCITSEGIVQGFSKALNKIIEIEEDLTKPLLKGEDVHRFDNLLSDKKVIFPYRFFEIDGRRKVELIDENTLSLKFPLGYNYFKINEVLLRERENHRFDIDGEWFQYGRKQGILFAEHEKLVAPDISLKSNFAFDKTGVFFQTTTLYGYIKKEEIEIDYKFYLALLNSSLLWWFLVKTGTTLANGYFRYKPDYLKSFPIPDVKEISVTTPFIRIVDIIMFLKSIGELKKINEYVSNNHIVKVLEDLLDAMVFELYFPEDFKEAKLEFIELVQNNIESLKWDELTEDNKIITVNTIYQMLRDKDNPLRNNLKLMDIRLENIIKPIKSA